MSGDRPIRPAVAIDGEPSRGSRDGSHREVDGDRRIPLIEPEEDINDARSALVLYIEDTPANVRLVERMLQRGRPDVELICAGSGKEGLELARARRPDLVLLDLNLPDLPGDEVLQELRQDRATAAIPIVMISGNAFPDNIQRLRSLGLAHYLTKPFTMKCLLDVVTGALENRLTRLNL